MGLGADVFGKLELLRERLCRIQASKSFDASIGACFLCLVLAVVVVSAAAGDLLVQIFSVEDLVVLLEF